MRYYRELNIDEKVQLFRDWLEDGEVEFMTNFFRDWKLTSIPCWNRDACYRKKEVSYPASVDWSHVSSKYDYLICDEGYFGGYEMRLCSNSTFKSSLYSISTKPFASFKEGEGKLKYETVSRYDS